MKKWEIPNIEVLSVQVTSENGTIKDGFDCLWIGTGPNGSNWFSYGPNSGSGPVVKVKATGEAAEAILASQQGN